MGTVNPAGRFGASPAQLSALNNLTDAQLTAMVNTLPIFTGTWADLLVQFPPASNSGKRALVVDPTFFVTPLRMRSDGVKWRLDGYQDLYFNITPMTGAGGTVTTEQLQMQWTAPAGFLTSLRSLSLKRVDYKSATSDTHTFRTRVGAGATPLTDASLGAGGGGVMVTTNRTIALETLLTFPAATTVRMLGTVTGVVAWPGVQSSGAYPTDATIPNSDSAATVFSCTFQLTTGTDSSLGGQAHLFVTGS